MTQAEMAYNPDHAVELAPRVWWVGHEQKGDPFQCHVYLIEQGNNSVLIDPGSKLTFAGTLRRIEEVVPFTSIRYFICQHQDPDITGAMPLIDQMISRPDAVIVTHWRAKMLIKHYELGIPFWLIDENDWRLQLDDRELRFCFTPYAHFPGAFTTFDPESGIMFSSDIFGGLTSQFSLFAENEGYLEAMKPFHQHYIPSNDIMQFVLHEIEKFPIRMIAPQHGSIIPEHLVRYMIDGLKSLDCGLYLLPQFASDFGKLARFNESLKSIAKTMIVHRDFKEIATALLEIIRREVEISELHYYARLEDGRTIHFAESNRYHGKISDSSSEIPRLLGRSKTLWQKEIHQTKFSTAVYKVNPKSGKASMMIPLFQPDEDVANAIIVMTADEKAIDDRRLAMMIEHMLLPLQVSIQRELLFREMETERDRIYQRSIRDPLTGMFTRTYMNDFVQKLLDQQDRHDKQPISLLITDIDYFKQINDSYGHNQGDIVIKRISSCIMERCREIDIPVRLGGEEFLVFSNNATLEQINTFAERLRQSIEGMQWAAPMAGKKVTASFGIAQRLPGESLLDFIERADAALYRAKSAGRNQVCQ